LRLPLSHRRRYAEIEGELALVFEQALFTLSEQV